MFVHRFKVQGMKLRYERHTDTASAREQYFLAREEVEAFEVGLKHRWDFIFSHNQCFTRSLML